MHKSGPFLFEPNQNSLQVTQSYANRFHGNCAFVRNGRTASIAPHPTRLVKLSGVGLCRNHGMVGDNLGRPHTVLVSILWLTAILYHRMLLSMSIYTISLLRAACLPACLPSCLRVSVALPVSHGALSRKKHAAFSPRAFNHVMHAVLLYARLFLFD